MDTPSSMSEETFLADDFFYKDSDTAPITISVRGRSVPFSIKRGVSAADIAAARKVAVKISFSPSGKPVLSNVDQEAFEQEIVFRCLKEWPFKEADGTPLPITRENLGDMAGDVVTALSQKIMSVMQGGQEANAPLESTSDAAS